MPYLKPKFTFSKAPARHRDTTVFIAGVYQNEALAGLPKPLQSAHGDALQDVLGQLSRTKVFFGKDATSQVLKFQGRARDTHWVLVGLGDREAMSGDGAVERLRRIGSHVASKATVEKLGVVNVLWSTFELSEARHAQALAEGIALSSYSFEGYRQTAKEAAEPTVWSWPAEYRTSMARALDDAGWVGECVALTRDWSNEPSNFGTPEYYAGAFSKIGKQHGLKMRVLNEAQAEREGLSLYLGVGLGSAREGRVVIAEYAPKGAGKASGARTKKIALVGKGVTFDSGGISIKPSLKMEDMKHDMTGAASVMGAMLLCAKRQVRARVVGVMAFTENMPSGTAIQPGNVIPTRAGKYVEIINTDAEGRLILADALDLAQDFKPDVVVNIATLTGAVSIALGKQACAVLGNDRETIQELIRAGGSQGERMWELPLWDEYFDDMKSAVADLKNSVNDSYGGTIRGAMFLKQFIRKGMKWAHLDIAGTAYGVTHVPYFPKVGATGAYVRTLARFVEDA